MDAMNAKVSGKNVVVKIPIDILVTAFNFKDDNYETYKVKNKQKFATGVAEYLLDYGSDSETGATKFEEVFDEIFDEMVCNAEEYIKEIQNEE